LNSQNFIREKFNDIGIELSDLQVIQLYTYYEMLIEKNKVMNLTAITDFEGVVVKHFVDSALISKIINMDEIESLIDIGTGAGFPGLLLKIIYPDIRVVLMDSLNKRIKFLNDVYNELNISNIEVIHSRAEDLAKKNEYREKFDLVVSRAVANLSTLSEYCVPFVKINGMFISYKADNVEEEVNKSKHAIKTLGAFLDGVRYVELDESTKRSFVLVKKIEPTSKKYPRKAGIPSSLPL